MTPAQTRNGKIALVVILGFPILAIVALVAWASMSPPAESQPGDPHRFDYGYVEPGQCMSEKDFNRRAAYVRENNDLSDSEANVMLSAVAVVKSMKQLNTRPCEDLRSMYERAAAAIH